MTLHPVGLVWLCTVDTHQQKVVLRSKLLRACHWCIPGTGEVQALCLVELRTWQQLGMVASHQGPLADFYPRESFGFRVGFCLWCHSDGAWLQGADGEPYQKLCWNPAKLHQLVAKSSPIARLCTVVMSWVSQDLFPEAMLVVTQTLVVLQKLHKMTMHYVFHDFTATRCQWNWSVVRSLALVPLLEQMCHESSFPVIRNLALFVGSLIYECQCWCDWRGYLFQESWWNLVRTTALCGFWLRSSFFAPFICMLRGGAEFSMLFPMVGIEVCLSIYLPIRLNPRGGHQTGSGEPSAGG